MTTKHFKLLIEPVNTDNVIFILWVTIEDKEIRLNLLPINSKFRKGPTLLGKYPLNDYVHIPSTIFNFVVGYIPAELSQQTREEIERFSNALDNYTKG